jgi:hypothetical protein
MPDPHAWDHWTIDSYNLVALGKNQTGKTSVLRELHAETPRVSIWLNEAGDNRVDGIKGKTVRSLGQLKDAFASDEWTIEWVSSDRAADVQRLRQWLWKVEADANRQLPVQVTADEIHRLAPQSNEKHDPPRDAVRMFGKEGVKRNIKFAGITQDPSAYDKQSLRQSEYRVVFDMSAEQQTALSEYGFDFETVQASDRHTATLHDASGRVIEERVKADEKYA